MYVSVKGGEKAIEAAHALLAEERRGDPAVPELGLDQIAEQLSLGVARVMSEGALYDRELAALAIKQARGDLVEAIFLLRAYRTTLPRLATSLPVDTDRMAVRRRISATFKDIPGGQVLGPTFDYTHRLLDFDLAQPSAQGDAARPSGEPAPARPLPSVARILGEEGLLEREVPGDDAAPVADLTRAPLSFPAERDARLQALARGDEGFLLALGYSTQRGYGRNHPFAGEIRMGDVTVEIQPDDLPFTVEIGDIEVTECQMVNSFKGSKTKPAQFTRGYGLTFGHGERKAMAMALVDRALRCRELGEEAVGPAQDEEFVLYHCDSLEASGFVQHLKLPHYVDFQSELVMVREMRKAAAEAAPKAEAAE
ncbi:carbon-phosphorus lyase complex subunit PhnI [Dongia sedimenti]|uniref:Carbon-phosphorus lyase complex subunit PhnI n=1 Tax=Dongia sedimenti TaxID=3064282 RepID=A0ABU0YW48_9PROT|nr:carbon-phosphorus lyase complex subunit PhnI [Rhodospirillaceae bacterium R-7]